MAPVINVSMKDKEKEKPKKPGERRTELICRVKFNNNLPDFPYDPKFITYPFDPNRFSQYKPTSLEKNHKHDLLTEHDLGVNIDLIDPEIYAIPPDYALSGGVIPLPLEDEKLLEEENVPLSDQKRSRHHNKVVPWLKKTEYISTEFNRYGASSEKTETKVGYNVKKLWKDENPYMDKECQIRAINKTFEDAKKPITEHHSKRNVTPIEVLEVFPDFSLWKYPFAQVQFDADPAPMSQMEEMSQAMIRGVMDESGEQFVAYFLPTKETLEKRAKDKENEVEYVEEEEYEYDMAREYNWNVKSKSSKGYEENYFFVFRDDGVFYNELETRVRLSKRRAKPESRGANSKLVVKHRPLSDQEFKTQELRLRMLQPPQEEEEEEQEEEKEEEHRESEDDKKEKADGEEEKLEREDDDNDEEDDNDEDDDNDEEESDNEARASNDRKKQQKSSSSSSGSSSSSDSSSESEDEEDEEAIRRKAAQDEAEIFGSDDEDDSG